MVLGFVVHAGRSWRSPINLRRFTKFLCAVTVSRWRTSRTVLSEPVARRSVPRGNSSLKLLDCILASILQATGLEAFRRIRERSTSVPSPPPLAPAKAFSRSGYGRIFSLFSRVTLEGLSTALSADGTKSVLPAPKSLNLMTALIW